MQSAADIRRKLQKLALGPEQSLESLLNLATSVFYNRDQEEQAERNRREQRNPVWQSLLLVWSEGAFYKKLSPEEWTTIPSMPTVPRGSLEGTLSQGTKVPRA
ncbi:hypothetical protein AAY473_036579 [Plecturocebus cupreus]